jgi:hypothetical protein
MLFALRRDGEAVELAREANREIANVDHLLNFAEPFRDNLARFNRDEAAKRVLMSAKLFAEKAHKLAALWRGHGAPGKESGMSFLDCALRFAQARFANTRYSLAGDGRARWQAAACKVLHGGAKAREQGAHFVAEVYFIYCGCHGAFSLRSFDVRIIYDVVTALASINDICRILS